MPKQLEGLDAYELELVFEGLKLRDRHLAHEIAVEVSKIFGDGSSDSIGSIEDAYREAEQAEDVEHDKASAGWHDRLGFDVDLDDLGEVTL